MSERYPMHPAMKRLALEAGGSTYPEVNTQQLVRYTELVVKECAELIRMGHHDMISRLVAANLIEEHFGVK